MKASKILFATDFSESSAAACPLASSLARDSGAKLLIAHVKEPPASFADTGFGGYTLHDDEEAREMLHDVRPTDPSVEYSHQMLRGSPADEIVSFAAEEGVDMIVIGSHGRTGIMRALLGSVAEAVVRRAPCPVLTAKPSREPSEDNH
ncbi:MAG: universal stress protein [Pirellulaceae bacterium]|jgi:nucleotide-binding universal stress UspA family protein|nr:universal stress protein [Pirellulaceae bacterium]MDP7019945.1 universal stress protein [Pirellulaceae bacterium]